MPIGRERALNLLSQWVRDGLIPAQSPENIRRMISDMGGKSDGPPKTREELWRNKERDLEMYRLRSENRKKWTYDALARKYGIGPASARDAYKKAEVYVKAGIIVHRTRESERFRQAKDRAA